VLVDAVLRRLAMARSEGAEEEQRTSRLIRSYASIDRVSSPNQVAR